MEAWQKAFLKTHERSKHSAIMLTLFDQETAINNRMATVERKTRRETTLNVNLGAIKNLMETLKLSAIEAMNALKIPTDQQAMYAAQL